MVRESHLILGCDVRLEKQPVVLTQASTAHSTATAVLFPEQGCRLPWQFKSKAAPGEIRNSSSRSEELESVTLLLQKREVSLQHTFNVQALHRYGNQGSKSMSALHISLFYSVNPTASHHLSLLLSQPVKLHQNPRTPTERDVWSKV